MKTWLDTELKDRHREVERTNTIEITIGSNIMSYECAQVSLKAKVEGPSM